MGDACGAAGVEANLPRGWGHHLTWVLAGLFHRSVISLRFSGRSSSRSACAASSMVRQKGSSHTGLALPGDRSDTQSSQHTPNAQLSPSTK